jgi:hypothetical protein
MPNSVKKLIPQVVVLAIALFWSWPSLKQAFFAGASSQSGEKKAAAVTSEFSAATLSPKFPPVPKRNPFELPSAPRTVKKKTKNSAQDEAKALAEVKDSGLILNATCIMGQQRLAMINGQVYREKEAIEGKGLESSPWVVTSILPHKVLLSYQGVPVQLGYSNGLVKPGAASHAKKSRHEKGADKPPK